jgi:glucose/arabinose dehydrogenase
VQKLTIAIIIFVSFFVSITLMSLGSRLGLFIVQAQPVNATGLLANLTDENHHWKPFSTTNVSQTNGNLTISIINNNTQKIFNRASLQTQLNTSTIAPPILTLDYASKHLLYPPARKPINSVEIRDVKSGNILWSALLNETSGKSLNDSYVLSSNVLNKPIEFRLYIITEGGPSHSSLSLKNLYVNQFGSPSHGGPKITDPNIKVEVLFKGLKFPTSMAFLGPNDLLVLEKNNRTVQRIINGTLQPKPVLDVNVATEGGRGMLGIAVAKHENGGPAYVFIYFIELSGQKDVDHQTGGRAHLYRYELENNRLINPKLLLDVSGAGGVGNKTDEFHNGGAIVVGPDQNVYLVVGELSGRHTLAQNVEAGDRPDGSSGILRVNQDGDPVKGGAILGETPPLDKYYAYGIRNSFGMDFDPVTGKLWETENGPNFGDEINLVEPGFNSGFREVQGIWKPNPLNGTIAGDIAPLKPEGLVDFNGKGTYRPPDFTWYHTVAPTALKFLNSDKLGKQYENDMFVGEVTDGNLYHFDLNKQRNKLNLSGPLRDKVADSKDELRKVIFGQGFKDITDIDVAPDGCLYILSYKLGAIFKIDKRGT